MAQTPKAHIKKWERLKVDSSLDRPNLERYARGEKFDYGIAGVPERFAYGLSEAGIAIDRVGRELMQQAQTAALRGEPGWLDAFNRAVGFQALGFALNVAWHEHAAAELRAGKRRQALKTLSLRDAGFLAGALLFLGQLPAARATAARCRTALSAGYFLDGDVYMPRRAQYFVLELMTDVEGERFNWPPVALDEPVYADLRARRGQADADSLVTSLRKACDRHVAESRAATDEEYPDFEAMESVYFPFEIHALMRLREQAGLAIPSLDHPLLDTALGRLPEARAPAQDALLAGVERASGIRQA